MTHHAASLTQFQNYRPVGRVERDHLAAALRVSPSSQAEIGYVGNATPADIAIDMPNHRKTYRRFLRFMIISSLASAVVLGALFLLIY